MTRLRDLPALLVTRWYQFRGRSGPDRGDSPVSTAILVAAIAAAALVVAGAITLAVDNFTAEIPDGPD